MKKTLLLGLSLVSIIGLASCNLNGIESSNVQASQNSSNSTPVSGSSNGSSTPSGSSSSNITTPSINGSSNDSSTPSGSDSSPSSSSTPSSTPSSTSEYISVNTDPGYTKSTHKVFMVGDSTMCNYSEPPKWYYTKYGYGSQMDKYFDTNYITFKNYAMSGRSSYSLSKETNYTTLFNEIGTNDYLIIGFGHNDEKYGTDTFRNANYTDIDTALADADSFQSCLYNSYILPAINKGAKPIIASPIVRLNENDDYSGNSGHNYTDKSNVYCGDYRKACEDLANKYNLPFIDLTTETKNEYKKLGASEAVKYHGILSGTDASEGKDPDYTNYDGTHINYYGANYIAYTFAKLLQNTSSDLKNYVKNGVERPNISILQKFDGYVWAPYSSPNLTSYSAPDRFKTTTAGWYGTAFGNMGGDSTTKFTAKETSTGVFEVSSTDSKGKITSSGDGFAFLFKQLAYNQNFKLSAKITVLAKPGDNTQSAFGIMLRDDCYINVTSKNESITSTFAACGYYKEKAFLSRTGGKLSETGSSLTLSSIQENDYYYMSLEQNGQTVTCIVKKGEDGQVMTQTFVDYEFIGIDRDYIYLGFFATRNAKIKVENVVYQDNGYNTGA